MSKLDLGDAPGDAPVVQRLIARMRLGTPARVHPRGMKGAAASPRVQKASAWINSVRRPDGGYNKKVVSACVALCALLVLAAATAVH